MLREVGAGEFAICIGVRMEQSLLIEKLTLFGLSRQEAAIYMTLFSDGALTGYEVSKLTGISRSNVYGGLAGLVEKGAAYLIEGSATKYIAVDMKEFCENRIRALNNEKDIIIENIPEKKKESDGYITIEGCKNILDKMINMIEQSEYRIYLSVTNEVLQLILPYIRECISKGKKVVLITDKEVQIPEALIYYNVESLPPQESAEAESPPLQGSAENSDIKNKQIQLIADSRYVLTGELHEACLYSGQKNFVNVFKQSLSNTIKLIELTREDKG